MVSINIEGAIILYLVWVSQHRISWGWYSLDHTIHILDLILEGESLGQFLLSSAFQCFANLILLNSVNHFLLQSDVCFPSIYYSLKLVLWRTGERVEETTGGTKFKRRTVERVELTTAGESSFTQELVSFSYINNYSLLPGLLLVVCHNPNWASRSK